MNGLIQELKNDAAGIATLKTWLGENGTPVDRIQAEHRAAICLNNCPQHRPFKWWEQVKNAIASFIKAALELKNKLDISTSRDDELFMCAACGCCTRLKIHAPIQHILKHLTEEQRSKLAPHCWILRGE